MAGSIALSDVFRSYTIDRDRSIKAIDGVTLNIPAGEVVGVLAPSGSGKSTLLRVIGGLERADSGTVVVAEQNLGELSARQLAAHRRRVGFVFQQFNLLPALTALDNVLAPVLPFKVPFDAEQRARELLQAVGLQGRETSLPSRLSGGEQQRVAIARALINYPELVLADEPTGNLDSRTGQDVIDLLLSLRERHGTTILITTHDPEVAGRCERLVQMHDGRVVGDIRTGAPAELTEDVADSEQPNRP
jgi:putative ABC transport system ATP-binding protein